MIEEYYWESQLFVQIFWIFVFQSKRKKEIKKEDPRWTWKPGFNTPLHSLSERHPPVTPSLPPTHIFVLVRLKLFRVLYVFILNVKWQDSRFSQFFYVSFFCCHFCQKQPCSTFDQHKEPLGLLQCSICSQDEVNRDTESFVAPNILKSRIVSFSWRLSTHPSIHPYVHPPLVWPCCEAAWQQRGVCVCWGLYIAHGGYDLLKFLTSSFCNWLFLQAFNIVQLFKYTH